MKSEAACAWRPHWVGPCCWRRTCARLESKAVADDEKAQVSLSKPEGWKTTCTLGVFLQARVMEIERI